MQRTLSACQLYALPPEAVRTPRHIQQQEEKKIVPVENTSQLSAFQEAELEGWLEQGRELGIPENQVRADFRKYIETGEFPSLDSYTSDTVVE